MVWWVAAAQGALSITGGLQAQDRAKKAAKATVALIEQETAEEVRRTQREFDFVFGQQQATIGGAGVTFAGTPELQTTSLRREQDLQIGWIRRAGTLRAEAARHSGQYVGRQAFDSGLSSGIGYFTQAYSQFGQQQQAQQTNVLGG